ncbi:MAG: RluA family pseudouridine synthase [Treponema sp.]|nr:RluA family pseudouridine synthase [Treponema sp.]
MINPLPQDKAIFYCYRLMEKFDKLGLERTILNLNENISEKTVMEKMKSLTHSSIFSKKTLTRSNAQMFGILVCVDDNGNEIVLKAFSGQFNGIWNIEGWVPPLLNEKKFIKLTKKSDKKIHILSDKIAENEKIIKNFENDSCENNLMFQKVSVILQKLKKKRRELSQKSMKDIFLLYSVPIIKKFIIVETSQWKNPKNGKVFPQYKVKPVFTEKSLLSFFNHNTEKKVILSNKQKNKILPPTGAGECCAPKLLAYAFRNNLRPVSLAEFYYGDSNKSGSKQHKKFYEPCDDKCLPLLNKMLGLDIIFHDENIVVVNKPSGLLSVPGRGEKKQDCVVNRIKYFFSNCIEQPSVHRLDQDTSGLLILALNERTHRALSVEFMENRVEKKYICVLEQPIQCGKGVSNIITDDEGKVISGHIELPFRLDVKNRPRQIYDENLGKMGITNFRVINLNKNDNVQINFLRMTNKTIVEFVPITGRTHQLRLHASSIHGLNSPICGDNLYGSSKSRSIPCFSKKTRLMLHAFYLSFMLNNKQYTFSLPKSFI